MTSVYCPSHKTAPLIEDWQAGDCICSECGLVVTERAIDVGTEWRTLSDDTEDRSRVGAVENIYVTQKEEIKAASILHDMIDRLNLTTSIRRLGQFYFHHIVKEGLHKGRCLELLCAVCICIACKKENVARSFNEIQLVIENKSLNLHACYNDIVDELKQKGHLDNLPISTKEDFFIRFCSKLNLSVDIEKLASKIALKIADLVELSGKRPSTLAATAIYLACQIKNVKINLSELANVSRVAESTIKSTYRICNKKLNLTDE